MEKGVWCDGKVAECAVALCATMSGSEGRSGPVGGQSEAGSSQLNESSAELNGHSGLPQGTVSPFKMCLIIVTNC